MILHTLYGGGPEIPENNSEVDFDHARFRHARSFKDRLKGGAIFPCHLNHGGHIPRAEVQ